jgi:ubiquinone/menaquinone biosynthesis C-methylase UbiE
MISNYQAIYDARQGYNIVANGYENWRWYKFWRENEGPFIKEWLKSNSGVGLDAGCGNAPYLAEYINMNSRNFLVDISEGMLKNAKKKLKKYSKLDPLIRKSISIIQSDIRNMPLRNEEFDFILCSRVLSNIKDFRIVLAEFSRLLKASGSILITDIHPSHSYEYTSVDTGNGRINIETYKHQLKEIYDFMPQVNLKVIERQEYSFLSLISKPEKKGFEKIYANPAEPIFYILKLTK